MAEGLSVVILKHVPHEDAGTILDYLTQENIPFQAVNLYENDHRFPSLDGVRALVVMGGPMNVYEEEKFPFLKEENAYILEAVRREVPFLGVCLGSQLLAKALGARVYKAGQSEVGWGDILLSGSASEDRLFSALGEKKLKVLQWHEDTFDLPARAVHLASSAAVPNQAYAVDGLFYGFQFHVEVTRPMLQDWFKNRPDLAKILEEYDAYRTELGHITEKIYERFFVQNR